MFDLKNNLQVFKIRENTNLLQEKLVFEVNDYYWLEESNIKWQCSPGLDK